MNKYLYKIKDLDIPTWVKYWFLKRSKINFDLSEILNGTSFDLIDTVNKKLHLINIFGNSEQVTTTGVQLLDFGNNAVTNASTYDFTNNNLVISSTSGNYNSIFYNITDLIKSNSGKVINFGYDSLVETVQRCYSLQLLINYIGDSKTYYHHFVTAGGYTIPNDTSTLERVRFGIYQNNSITSNPGTLTIVKPILYFGETKPDYEPYTDGASPNPNYPQEIKSSGDNGYIVEKFVNKNFLNLIDVEPITYKGVTETINNKIICLNGTANGTVFLTTGNDYFNLKAGTYTLSANNEQVLTSNCRIRIVTSQGSTINGLSVSLNVKDSSITFTINEDLENVTLQIRIEDGIILNNFTIKPQIEKGSTATDYEQHQSQAYTIPCQQPMRAIGDVKDTFVKVNGVWYERHYIKLQNLTSDLVDSVTQSSQYGAFANLKIEGKNDITNILAKSNIAIGVCFNDRLLFPDDYRIFINNTGYIALRFPAGGLSTKTAIMNYIDELNETMDPYFIYALKAPQDLPCTQEQITALENLQKAKTYKNVTHIFSEDNIPPNLQIQYYKEKGE